MNTWNLYKTSKRVYRECSLHSQLTAAGGNQAKFLDGLKKNKHGAYFQSIIMKILIVIYIAALSIIPITSYKNLLTALEYGIDSEWVILISGLSQSLFLGLQLTFLIVFSVMFSWGLVSGGPYRWIQTLPFSKKEIERISLLTFIRSMDLPLIAMTLVLPIGTAISSRSILLTLISLLFSLVNVVFNLSIIVILSRKMAQIMESQEKASKRSSVIRIVSVSLYLMSSMLMMYVIQATITKIPDLFFKQTLYSETASLISTILSFIPLFFAGGYILTLPALNFSSIPLQQLVGSIVGIVIFIIITYFLLKKALDTLRNISIIQRKEERVDTEKILVSDIRIIKSSPVHAFLKRDLVISTRELQMMIYLIMPVLMPLYGLMLGFTHNPIGENGLTEGFCIIIFQAIIFTTTLIVGLTTVASGGTTITSALPISIRDQIKAKIPFFLGTIPLAYIVWILTRITRPNILDVLPFELTFLLVLPIIAVAGMFFKILLFGKLKYKYVLEEVRTKNRIVKYVTVFIFIAALAIGFILSSLVGLWLLGVLEIVSVIILVVVFNMMFPRNKLNNVAS